jgi:hypothetical protein
VRNNPPHGINCVVAVPVRGLVSKSERVVAVRTVWLITDTSHHRGWYPPT